MPADPDDIPVCEKRTDNADQKKRYPEFPVAKSGQVNCCNGSDDHQIKHKAGNPVEHEVVGILSLHNALCPEFVADVLKKDSPCGAHEEIEAPDQRVDGIHTEPACRFQNEMIQQPHGRISNQIGEKHQTELNGQFIHRFRDGNFISAGNPFGREIFHCFRVFRHSACITGTAHFVQIVDTAYTGRNKAHCRNGEAEV